MKTIKRFAIVALIMAFAVVLPSATVFAIDHSTHYSLMW